MVTTFYPPYHFGGDAIYVHGLVRSLVAHGHHVEVVHCTDAWRMKGFDSEPVGEDSTDVRLHRLHSRYGFLSPLMTQQTGRPVLKRRKLEEILDIGFDVIHFHNISLIGGPAALPMGKARLRLFTPHEFWAMCPTHVFWKNRRKRCDRRTCLSCSIRSGIPPQFWRWTKLMRRSFAWVDTILAPSRHCADVYEREGLGPPVRVLPLFCDMPSRPGDGQGGYFLYAGRLERLKGCLDLLEAFDELDAQLWIAGAGSLQPQLQAASERRENVHLLGNRPHHDIAQVMADATAVIAPSRVPEIFGLSVVEGFAQGAPAIVADEGGLSELVLEHGAGFVYRNRNELVNAVCRLRDERELRTAMGQRALAAFKTEYTPELHVSRYLDIVEGHLGGGAS
jgi:glycosyltransferase involved in cell wall biosynthesis